MHDDGHDPGEEPEDFDEFAEEEDAYEPPPLDEHESALVRQDLVDLDRFYNTFGAEGFRGVSVYCHDCAEEHYYPWDMLRENLHTLLDTGETPVHEPAFAPDPDEYVPWEYARGYVDALQDVGVDQRSDASSCRRCGFDLPVEMRQGNFCPRCGAPLLAERLRAALDDRGLEADDVLTILRELGLPG